MTEKTATALDKAEQYLAGGTLGMFKLPRKHQIVIDRGQGCRIWDLDGAEYIDYTLGSGPMILGHAHPAVLEAVTRQSELGSTYYGLNEPAILLAERLVKASPCAEQVRFVSSGTDATFSAIRLARAYTGKTKVLKFNGGWHGGHDYAQQDPDPDRPGWSRPISDGIPRSVTDTVITCDFNDTATAVDLISQHAPDLAAVIVEPLQRAISPKPGFLDALRDLTQKHEALLIFDEIVTGFRLSWGGAQEHYGVIPDLVVYGKTSSGGYPLAAICGPQDVMNCAAAELKGSGRYAFISGTFNGNPISCAAGLATLDELAKPGIYRHLHKVSSKLQKGLESIAAESGHALRVLGEGPVLQPFFSDRALWTHAETQATDLQKQRALGLGLLKKGFFVKPSGKLYLSTIHTDEIVEQTLDAARSVLAELL